MKGAPSYTVFVSYTGDDLEAHADIVADMIRRLNADTERRWAAIDHKFWSPTGRPSVQECMERVDGCDILIVLVAFRYGWVPTQEEGGDGESSITRMEVARARASGLEVIPFLANDDAHWNVAQMEGLNDPVAQRRLLRFKGELRKSLAGFFDSPESLEVSVVLALNKAADRIERSRPTRHAGRAPDSPVASGEIVIPSYFDSAQPPTLEDRLQTQLPKRILAIGSGGVRTAIALGYLERLEQVLRARYGDPDFRLSGYFDLIGASGVGAIVAAELSRGRSVSDARNTYLHVMTALLTAASSFRLMVRGVRSSPSKVDSVLNAVFGDTRFVSPDLRTGLCVILTRIDTGEIWSLSNHPSVRSSERGDLPLYLVLRAALASPVLLPPVQLQINNEAAQLAPGELSVGPDPALHLFLIATGPTFPFKWRTGQRRIFLVSIGSGSEPVTKRAVPTGSMMAAFASLPTFVTSLLDGLKQQSNVALAALTHEGSIDPAAPPGDAPLLPSSAPILTYRRLDVLLSGPQLEILGLASLAHELHMLLPFDNLERIEAHLEIGRRAANREVNQDFFSASFDVRPVSASGGTASRTTS